MFLRIEAGRAIGLNLTGSEQRLHFEQIASHVVLQLCPTRRRGQNGSAGRTRCLDRIVTALAAPVGLNRPPKQPDRRGSIPIDRNNSLLFIDQPISHAA
jgi:hypothetical protein